MCRSDVNDMDRNFKKSLKGLTPRFSDTTPESVIPDVSRLLFGILVFRQRLKVENKLTHVYDTATTKKPEMKMTDNEIRG